MKRLKDFWEGLPTHTKLAQGFNLLWLPFWFFADLPPYFTVPAILFIALVNVGAARLICHYFGWVE